MPERQVDSGASATFSRASRFIVAQAYYLPWLVLKKGRPPSPTSPSARAAQGDGNEALRLALIAPKLVQATLDGTLPRTVTLESLLRAALPMDWQDQQQLFGASR